MKGAEEGEEGVNNEDLSRLLTPKPKDRALD